MNLLRASGLVLIAATFSTLGCGAAQQPGSSDLHADTRAADEAAIRKADEDWVKAAMTKQAAAWVAFYSDDAAVLPPNEKTAVAKDDIRKSVAGLLGLPALTITWKATKIEVARAGDLASDYGTYDITFTDPKGKPMTDHGKYLEVWKKQADGGWKCVLDMWSSDAPA